MNAISISNEPPAHWPSLCNEHKLVFHSAEWTGLLASCFGTRTQYVWDEAAQSGAAVSSFAAGPFRLGFLGFPYGGMVGGGRLEDALLQRCRQRKSELLPVAIRVPVSAFGKPAELSFPYDATPETAIVDLPSWSLDVTSGNHRRDVKKALRSDLVLMDAERVDDGTAIFEIYRDTVQRHRGGLRYNEAYFRELVMLGKSHPHVRVTLARLGETIAGFTIIVRHGDTACYLHGGIRLEHRACQPSALLLNAAIEWARGTGCQCFNLMSSPAGQESLVWYKEKWGAVTREHRSYTVPLRASYPLFRIAERVHRLLG